MAGKSKKASPRKPPSSGDALRQEVERLIRKEQYKEAVKQVKIHHRDAATEESHRLLERAYLLRARQLQRAGMRQSAAEVAGHLVEFGLTDAALVEDVAQLLLSVGMLREADSLLVRVESPEARARLALVAFDEAVLHPDRAAGAPPEVRRGAELVRAALEAVEAGGEAKAVDGLREVSRSSPMADWKLFARGLAAFRRRDAGEAGANWDRLDPGRAASRIARALRGPGAVATAAGDPARPARAPDFTALERLAFGEPILAPLEHLRDLVARGQWTEAVRELGPIRHALRRVGPALAERLTRILLHPLIREAERLDYGEARRLVGNFTRLAEPLAIDPHWNRLWALIWEGPQADSDGSLAYWAKYLDDLKASPALSADERVLAQALVWRHLAVLALEQADEPDESDGPGPPFSGPKPPPGPTVLAARRQAVACLEESIRLAPTHLPAHDILVHAHERWDRPGEAAAAARRLLEAFPDHLDTLIFLADHELKRGRPEQALDYARRARALKPLDVSLGALEWSAHVMMARHLALGGRFDEGRAEFAAADRAMTVEPRQRYHHLARKAAFELKAGRADVAEALIDEARSLLPEPGPLWLALEIEAGRYDLPKADRDRFAGLGQAARKARRKGQTAGLMAELLRSLMAVGIEYPGRDVHIREVVEYLGRPGRIKYTAEDLRRVCEFLAGLPAESHLLETMVRRGVREFPEDALFHFLLASLELQKGPFRASLHAVRRHFEEALKLARASNDPRDAVLLPKLKEGLALVEGMTSGPLGMLPDFGPGGPTLADLFAAIGPDDDLDEFDDFDEFDDDDEDFGPPADAAPRPPRGRRPARKRKRK